MHINLIFRLILILMSLCTFLYVIRKIKKSQMSTSNSIFWVLFTIGVLLLSIFPKIIFYFTILLGIESPVNFVYLCIIFALIIKVFLLSIEVSKANQKIVSLVQSIGIEKRMEEEPES